MYYYYCALRLNRNPHTWKIPLHAPINWSAPGFRLGGVVVRSSKSMYTCFHLSAVVIKIEQTASKTHQKGRLSQGDTDDRRRIAKGYLAQTDKPTYEEVVMVPLATTTEGHDGRKTEAQVKGSEGHPCVLGKLEQTSRVLLGPKRIYAANVSRPGVRHHQNYLG